MDKLNAQRRVVDRTSSARIRVYSLKKMVIFTKYPAESTANSKSGSKAMRCSMMLKLVSTAEGS